MQNRCRTVIWPLLLYILPPERDDNLSDQQKWGRIFQFLGIRGKKGILKMEFSHVASAENSFVHLLDKIGLNIPAYWMM